MPDLPPRRQHQGRRLRRRLQQPGQAFDQRGRSEVPSIVGKELVGEPSVDRVGRQQSLVAELLRLVAGHRREQGFAVRGQRLAAETLREVGGDVEHQTGVTGRLAQRRRVLHASERVHALHDRHVAALEMGGTGEDMGGRRDGRRLEHIEHRQGIQPAECLPEPVGPGYRTQRVGARHDQHLDRSGLDFVHQGGRRPLAEATEQIPAGRTGFVGWGRPARALGSEVPRVEPHPALAIERPGDRHQRPRHPLGDVAVSGHRGAGTGLHSHLPLSPDLGDQGEEIVLPDTSDRRSSGPFEGLDGTAKLVDAVRRRGQEVLVRTRRQNLTDDVTEDRPIGARPWHDVVVGHGGRLGLPHVETPQRAVARQSSKPLNGIGPGVHVTVGGRRVRTHQHRHPRVRLVDEREDVMEAAHLLGHPEAGHLIDRRRGVDLRRAEVRSQPPDRGDPCTVEVRACASEHGHRLGPVSIDRLGDDRGEVGEGVVPAGHGSAQARREKSAVVGLDLADRPALGAGVAPTHRVVAVGAHRLDHPVLDVDDEPAVGLTDPTEGTGRGHDRTLTSTAWPWRPTGWRPGSCPSRSRCRRRGRGTGHRHARWPGGCRARR